MAGESCVWVHATPSCFLKIKLSTGPGLHTHAHCISRLSVMYSVVLSTRVCSVNLISYVDNVVENVEVTNYGNIFSENPPNCCTLSHSAQWTCQAALWEAICKCINYAVVGSDLDQPVTINHCVYCHYYRND